MSGALLVIGNCVTTSGLGSGPSLSRDLVMRAGFGFVRYQRYLAKILASIPSWSSRGLGYAFLFAHEHACLVRPSAPPPALPPLSRRPCAPLFRPSPLPSIELPHGDFLHPSVIEVMQLVLWPLGHLRV